MHPHLTGELARLRAQDIARESATRNAHHVHRREVRSAGFLLSNPARHAVAAMRLRARVGTALIRLGMRIADPDTQLRGVTAPR